MCPICRRRRCAGGCPNAPEMRPALRCSGCRRAVFAGQAFWRIGHECFCQSCIDAMYRIAEGEEEGIDG